MAPSTYLLHSEFGEVLADEPLSGLFLCERRYGRWEALLYQHDQPELRDGRLLLFDAVLLRERAGSRLYQGEFGGFRQTLLCTHTAHVMAATGTVS